VRTSLHSLQLPFNELFHQFAVNRLLRPRFAVFKSTGIFTRLSSDSPLGYSLEADLPNSVLHRIGILGLTVNRTLTYFIVTHAYICFSNRSTKPYSSDSTLLECSPTIITSIASVIYFMPVYYSRRVTRLVSCYALFK
jgi:hypothetical protein